MRSNAPIPALLALAALFLLPACSLARTTHHLAPKTNKTNKTNKTAATAASHPARKAAAVKPLRSVRETARPSRHHSSANPTLSRVQGSPTRHHRHRAATPSEPTPQPDHLAENPVPQKATSADFLKAAEPSPIPAAVAIHGTAQVDEPSEAPRSSPPQRHEAAPPVPVVSVIRPSAERPQLRSVEEVASTPVILPALYNKRGRLIVPPPLKGSHEILLHQNQVADRDGLQRIQNDEDLLNMRNQGLLVALPTSSALDVDERLPENRRFCRPWTAQFLATLARAHYAHFHTSLQINSAVRTVEFQQHLMHINGNAAPAEGDTASPHLTGQAIDIAKHGLGLTEIAWMRGYLLPLVQQGKIDVEEEFQQSCFHISVYKRYLPPDTAPKRYLASSHHSETTALATAIR